MASSRTFATSSSSSADPLLHLPNLPSQPSTSLAPQSPFPWTTTYPETPAASPTKQPHALLSPERAHQFPFASAPPSPRLSSGARTPSGFEFLDWGDSEGETRAKARSL